MGTQELPSRKQVLERLFEKWSVPRHTERVATKDAFGRVLAEDVFSLSDKPVFRASRMDGVAVKSVAFKDGVPDTSEWKPGLDYIRADTGDDFDDAFDAVIAIESVEILPNGALKFAKDLESVVSGSNVSGKGESLKSGALIGAKGSRMTPCDLAALAIGAVSEVTVLKKPTVAFIPTGSELIPLGEFPKRGQAVEANSLIAEYMLREMGAEPIILPIVKDVREALTSALNNALKNADVVVLSAGTSKGSEDYSHAILSERGTLICHGVATAPGRPMAVAIVDGKPVVNVAGPPLGCYNGFDWCVRAIVHAFLEQPPLKRRFVTAKLVAPENQAGQSGRGSGDKFELLRRFNIEETPEGYVAKPTGGGRGVNAADGLRAEAQCYGNPPESDGKVTLEIVK
jgi:molybdopterin molybdotransferase/putative molybdopterin biosynthesis protein